MLARTMQGRVMVLVLALTVAAGVVEFVGANWSHVITGISRATVLCRVVKQP
jgi:hypothetical protein